MVRTWNQGVYSHVVSSSSPVVANIMVTEGLHGR
jgi:hypothetical protein